ncbi:hypothetical protein Lmor_0458 [Legionella moravica]|uniref:Uncharacterized protein n=1 Tax=Legionella moravica TaxID=39962 RepID=A0A378JWB8_9GAMM|nr:hypothetical protein Lmor_0458 [Legionella moravica]STX61658.1 Uncharacterised protein [Legionella moravica]
MVALYFDKNFNVRISLFANSPKTRRSERGTCNAKTRKNTLCHAPSVWDNLRDRAINGRCKLHGGLSTGPKTESGRQAIRESNRRRKK